MIWLSQIMDGKEKRGVVHMARNPYCWSFLSGFCRVSVSLCSALLLARAYVLRSYSTVLLDILESQP